jgi:hypothetical protein
LWAGAIVLALAGCDKLRSALGRSDGGPSAAASPSPVGAESPLAFLNGFEGEIALSMTEKTGKAPETTPISIFVKSDKLRFDLPEKLGARNPFAAKGYVIFDGAAKKLYIVSDAQRQVLVVDLNSSGQKLKGLGSPSFGGGGGGGPGHEEKKMTLLKTGKYDTVAGYKCENWDVSSDHRDGTVCVAQEGVSWFHIPMTGIPTEHLWMAELLDGKHFPLRFIGYAKDGTTENTRVEVTKIDKKTLSPQEFEYPPTYRVVDIAQMFAGLPTIPSGIPTHHH